MLHPASPPRPGTCKGRRVLSRPFSLPFHTLKEPSKVALRRRADEGRWPLGPVGIVNNP